MSDAKATILKHQEGFIVHHFSDSVSDHAGIDHCFNSVMEATVDFYKHDPKGHLAVKPGTTVFFPSRNTIRWQGKHYGFDCHDAGKEAEYRWQGIKQQTEKVAAMGGQSLASFLANV